MTCKQLAAELLKTPKAKFLLQAGNEWVDVFGIVATGVHRNAVTVLVRGEIQRGKSPLPGQLGDD